MADRYYSVEIPRPGKRKPRTVTVRFGSYGPYYLCVGNQRIPMSSADAWAAWLALGKALRVEATGRPRWVENQMPGAEDMPGWRFFVDGQSAYRVNENMPQGLQIWFYLTSGRHWIPSVAGGFTSPTDIITAADFEEFTEAEVLAWIEATVGGETSD